MSVISKAQMGAMPGAISLRAEVRRALLAATETCWVYAALATVSALAEAPRVLSPISIWLAYWAALEIGYYLPRWHLPWRVLQALNVGLAILVTLIALCLGLYLTTPGFDLSWLLAVPRNLFTLGKGLAPEQLGLVTLLYAYVRGSGYGQRPLTLWFVGFQFRLGVLIFFGIALLSAVLGSQTDMAAPLIVFFILSLLSIALARIDESGRERGIGTRWALLLIAAAIAIVLVGLFVTPIFTIAGESLIIQFLSPVVLVLVLLVNLIMIPLAWLVSTLVGIIVPMMGSLFQTLRNFGLEIAPETPQSQQQVPAILGQLAALWPYVRILGIIALVFWIGWLVARALNRRMMQAEQESYFRETVGNPTPEPRAEPKRSNKPRLIGREIESENIRRIYAALLDRAATLGLPRREAETPFEFLPRLVARFPESASELERITDAYVAVHYAEQPASRQEVNEIRGIWRRVRSELKGDRKAPAGERLS